MLFKIEFEDHGQDFLFWTIDTQKEKVVDCGPFQYTVWVGLCCKQKAFEVGGKVAFIDDDGNLMEMLYPIRHIEIITE